MTSSKFLTEARWKDVASQHNVKNGALLKALAVLERAPGDRQDEALRALDEVGRPAAQTRKAKEEATLRVTPPGGTPTVLKLALGEPEAVDGSVMHVLTIKDFRATYPSLPPGAPITGYRIDAYLPQALGGDYFSGTIGNGD